jgi:hypothetical protein
MASAAGRIQRAADAVNSSAGPVYKEGKTTEVGGRVAEWSGQVRGKNKQPVEIVGTEIKARSFISGRGSIRCACCLGLNKGRQVLYGIMIQSHGPFNPKKP